MSTEYPHVDDLPFTVLSYAPDHEEVGVKHVRSATPHQAMLEAIDDGISPENILGVFENHIVARDFDDDQPYNLVNHKPAEEVHQVLSEFRAGDESYSLMPGYINQEPTTFLVQVQEITGSDGESYKQIAPLMIPIPNHLITEVRDDNGVRLVSVKSS